MTAVLRTSQNRSSGDSDRSAKGHSRRAPDRISNVERLSRHSSAGRRQHRGRRHVVSLRGLTIVAVMQAADLRRDDDLAGSGTRRPAVRGVFAQAEMRAAPMVVGEIRAKHAAEPVRLNTPTVDGGPGS
jgi:hypothetical protein